MAAYTHLAALRSGDITQHEYAQRLSRTFQVGAETWFAIDLLKQTKDPKRLKVNPPRSLPNKNLLRRAFLGSMNMAPEPVGKQKNKDKEGAAPDEYQTKNAGCFVFIYEDTQDMQPGQGVEALCGGHRVWALQEILSEKGEAQARMLLEKLKIPVVWWSHRALALTDREAVVKYKNLDNVEIAQGQTALLAELVRQIPPMAEEFEKNKAGCKDVAQYSAKMGYPGTTVADVRYFKELSAADLFAPGSLTDEVSAECGASREMVSTIKLLSPHTVKFQDQEPSHCVKEGRTAFTIALKSWDNDRKERGEKTLIAKDHYKPVLELFMANQPLSHKLEDFALVRDRIFGLLDARSDLKYKSKLKEAEKKSLLDKVKLEDHHLKRIPEPGEFKVLEPPTERESCGAVSLSLQPQYNDFMAMSLDIADSVDPDLMHAPGTFRIMDAGWQPEPLAVGPGVKVYHFADPKKHTLGTVKSARSAPGEWRPGLAKKPKEEVARIAWHRVFLHPRKTRMKKATAPAAAGNDNEEATAGKSKRGRGRAGSKEKKEQAGQDATVQKGNEKEKKATAMKNAMKKAAAGGAGVAATAEEVENKMEVDAEPEGEGAAPGGQGEEMQVDETYDETMTRWKTMTNEEILREVWPGAKDGPVYTTLEVSRTKDGKTDTKEIPIPTAVLMPEGSGQRLKAEVGEIIDPALLVRGVALPFCVVRGNEKIDMTLSYRFTEKKNGKQAAKQAEKRALNDGKQADTTKNVIMMEFDIAATLRDTASLDDPRDMLIHNAFGGSHVSGDLTSTSKAPVGGAMDVCSGAADQLQEQAPPPSGVDDPFSKFLASQEAYLGGYGDDEVEKKGEKVGTAGAGGAASSSAASASNSTVMEVDQPWEQVMLFRMTMPMMRAVDDAPAAGATQKEMDEFMNYNG